MSPSHRVPGMGAPVAALIASIFASGSSGGCGPKASDDAGTPSDSDTDTDTDSDTDTDTDADTDADTDTACTTYADGDYTWGEWTCSDGMRTTDVRAFAMSIGIASVDETITGLDGVVHVLYAGGGACTRTTEFTLDYPSCDTVTDTTATDYTCTGTCDPGVCTSGTQASLVDTYDLSQDGPTVTATRELDAAFAAQPTLQLLAGCQVGDTEVATLVRQ